MSKIYQSLTELVGNTPLLEIKNIEAQSAWDETRRQERWNLSTSTTS